MNVCVRVRVFKTVLCQEANHYFFFLFLGKKIVSSSTLTNEMQQCNVLSNLLKLVLTAQHMKVLELNYIPKRSAKKKI